MESSHECPDASERRLSSTDIAAALDGFAPHCRYVREAWVSADGRTVRATLGISTPYYIDDTGHFNSVEFNLCAEQLLALVCHTGGQPGDSGPPLTVTRLSSKFPSPMNAARFAGELCCRPENEPGTIAADVRFWNATGGPSHGLLVARQCP